METIKLFDSELKIMEIIWQHTPVSAKDVSMIAAKEIGWNKNTTYTIIKKLIEKSAVRRTEPNFICTPLINKEDVQQAETETLINKFFNGSKKALLSSIFASFTEDTILQEEYDELLKIIEKK